MIKNDIDKLFEDALQKWGQAAPEGTKEIFNSLAGLTLQYRDELVSKGMPALTVAEVEDALYILQQTVSTGVFPKAIPNRLVPLLERWLLALSPKDKKQ
ncbi:MAG: hypothetical protein HYY43_01640 [Deltaproteobacteria bacterium]|nr:hypothetical protein [Deltaproteobacteria bacterium]MBI2341884.1 hypothetical protein [Deltaproteobacteria bacterium]MBI2974279.1 hypothetical protein [Deltaproteobacteria bacterium]